MSLKALHIVFVSASVLLGLCFATWGFLRYATPQGTSVDLAYGIGSLVGVAALLVYGRYFLKKLRNVSYL